MRNTLCIAYDMTYMAKRWPVRQIVLQISGISNLGSRSEYAMSLVFNVDLGYLTSDISHSVESCYI